MTERITCIVPFCLRTYHNREGHSEWICQKHWRLVSRQAKASLRLNCRRIDKVLRHRPDYREYWTMPSGSPSRLSAVAMWRRHGQVWDRCKMEAIEGAAGI